jgi:hypothetical protein
MCADSVCGGRHCRMSTCLGPMVFRPFTVSESLFSLTLAGGERRERAGPAVGRG